MNCAHCGKKLTIQQEMDYIIKTDEKNTEGIRKKLHFCSLYCMGWYNFDEDTYVEQRLRKAKVL